MNRIEFESLVKRRIRDHEGIIVEFTEQKDIRGADQLSGRPCRWRVGTQKGGHTFAASSDPDDRVGVVNVGAARLVSTKRGSGQGCT